MHKQTRLVGLYDGVRCMYCGMKMPRDATHHPMAIEFINGYPSACRKAGVSLFVHDETLVEWVWLLSDTRFEWKAVR